MRTKTSDGGRARPPKFPSNFPSSSPSSTTQSLPSLNPRLHEANGESSIGRIVPGSSSKKNDDNDDDIASAYNDDETDIRAEIHSGLGHREDCMDMDMDWSEGETCLKCHRGGGNMLVCSQSGCPIALHRNCINGGPKFDEVGTFYCPYCWYKREVVRAKELRKKAIEAKKALACFIDLERVGGDKEEYGKADKQKLNMSSLDGEKSYGDFEDRMDTDQVDRRSAEVEENLQINGDNAKLAGSSSRFKVALENENDPLTPLSHPDENISHTQEKTPGAELLANCISKERTREENVSKTVESGILEDGPTLQEKDPRQVDDNAHERIADEDGLHEEPHSACCVEEENVVDGALNLSKEGTHGTVKLKLKRGEEEEKMDPKTSETEVSDCDQETIAMRQRRVTRNSKKAQLQNVDAPRKSSSTVGEQKIARAQNDKVTSSKKSTQQASAGKLTTLTFGNEKRKRLHWTAEEEEMLKEGVQKFSSKVNKNLPWRKVLEFGRHVFDPTRTPSDLKDKWRNIMAKDSSSISRR